MRSWIILVAVMTVAALSLSTGSAGAATRLTATITCDAATGTLSTRLDGGGALTANTRYMVEFRVRSGSFVTNTGAQGVVGTSQPPTTVSTASGPDGVVSVAGYTKPWPAADYLFYTETVRVTVRDAALREVEQRDGTCDHDLRTTVTLTCDPQTRTITARATGQRFTANRPVRVEYTWSTRFQSTAHEPGFIRHFPSEPDYLRSAPTSATGTWSNTGYVHTVPGEPYYLDHTVKVAVRDPMHGRIIGKGTAYCLYTDNS